MALLNSPPYVEPMFTKDGRMSIAWTQWFSQVFRGTAFYGSGTTANRPNPRDLKTGGYYFDTSLGALGKPIYLDKNGTGWVLADGTAV